jgi:hypothetical protein
MRTFLVNFFLRMVKRIRRSAGAHFSPPRFSPLHSFGSLLEQLVDAGRWNMSNDALAAGPLETAATGLLVQ